MRVIKDIGLKLNRVYCIDCVKGLSKLKDNSVDLTVTSPPYDKLRKYNGDIVFDFETVAENLFRVTKQGGVVVWISGDQTINGSETGTSFRQALYFKDIGFNIHDTMIYQKSGCATPERNRYYRSFEYMFVFSKGKPKTVNLLRDRPNTTAGALINNRTREYDGTFRQNSAVRNGIYDKRTPSFGVRFNIWRYKPENLKDEVNKIKFKHPAVFPDLLAQDHILSWSKKSDIVLDPFAGSGTTLVKAKELERNFIGFEISEEYADICRERLKYV